jgi:hypothetical protein
MLKLLNKKGDERVLGFYWIIVFVLIAVGVVSATIVFFDSYDIREVEASILGDRIVDCISENGELRNDVVDDLQEGDLEEICGFNFNDDFYDKNQYYVYLNVNGISENEFSKDGTDNLWPLCGAKDVKKEDKPGCFDKKIMILDKGEFILVELNVAIAKNKQN